MYKPIVFNRHLNEKWSAINNEIMMKKLNGVKSKLNNRCPESFYFYKKHFNRTSERNTKMQQYEVQKNNVMMLHKLVNVVEECHNNEVKRRTPKFSFKNTSINSQNKFEIIRVAQENQLMYKRMTERGPFYHRDKWITDYQKHMYYKQNKCIYPSIDFGNTSGTFYTENRRFGLSKKKPVYCYTSGNIPQKSNMSSGDDEDKEILPKVLYKTVKEVTGLGLSALEFSIQPMSFTIKIEPKNDRMSAYVIKFDSKEAIDNIQRYYAKYDEMIDDIKYDVNDDYVKFDNTTKPDLICKSIKLPPKTVQCQTEEDDDVREIRELQKKIKIQQKKKEEEEYQKKLEMERRQQEEEEYNREKQERQENQEIQDNQVNNDEDQGKVDKEEDIPKDYDKTIMTKDKTEYPPTNERHPDKNEDEENKVEEENNNNIEQNNRYDVNEQENQDNVNKNDNEEEVIEEQNI